jgi:hypothetical protein
LESNVGLSEAGVREGVRGRDGDSLSSFAGVGVEVEELPLLDVVGVGVGESPILDGGGGEREG